jgi:hypothetical protein
VLCEIWPALKTVLASYDQLSIGENEPGRQLSRSRMMLSDALKRLGIVRLPAL